MFYHNFSARGQVFRASGTVFELRAEPSITLTTPRWDTSIVSVLVLLQSCNTSRVGLNQKKLGNWMNQTPQITRGTIFHDEIQWS